MFLIAGTLALVIAAWLTPLGFLVDHMDQVGRYHFAVPVGTVIPVAHFGSMTAIPTPVLWLMRPALLVVGVGLRARLTFPDAAGLVAAVLAVFPVAALVFLLLSTFWPMGM